MFTKKHRRGASALALAGGVAVLMSACSPGSGSTDAADDSLLVWTWDTSVTTIAEQYEAANPGVTVEVVNVGTGNDQYTALQNAVAAGDGLPDVAFLESTALPQFALSGALTDLGPLGASGLADKFAPGPWSASQIGDKVYGLPWASGPMVMFYNEAVFAEHGVDVPTTWPEYVSAAKELHAADPDVWILNDNGDAGLAESLIWQAGGTPFEVDGTDVSIDVTDDGTSQYAENWQKLIDDDSLSSVPTWSDDWLKMLNAGQIATLPAGSWMASTLQSSVPDGAGDWRVAALPPGTDGASTSAEHGGGVFSVLEEAPNKDLAFDFASYATVGDGVSVIQDMGLWPSAVEPVQSEDFLTKEYDYFGGQQINQVFAEASANVPEGFQFLPYQVYANGIFNDTVGRAYNKGVTLEDGLAAWQDALVTYGTDQGFAVQ